MGQGQAEVAMNLLRQCAKNGDWLCLKNIHLVVSWLPTLEKEVGVTQRRHIRIQSGLSFCSAQYTHPGPRRCASDVQHSCFCMLVKLQPSGDTAYALRGRFKYRTNHIGSIMS